MVKIPDRLRDLLPGSAAEAAVLELAAAAGAILDDNKTPFFPAYTDHGSEHIARVLDACVRLVPDAVWDGGLLEPEDAAVLVGATFLHDLALHIREPGFLMLVTDRTSLRAVRWFDEQHGDRAPDVAWSSLWQAFRKEVRHFTQSQLDRILGSHNDGTPAIAHGDGDTSSDHWTDADRLIVGEFLRRHHARLSHELALGGFPGLASDDFPVLKQRLPTLADAIGVTARSHNEPMRRMLDYLEYVDRGSQRPGGALLPYLMSLLRIADYLQLDAPRAPKILLKMREPQSPQSVDEWNKHRAVASIVWNHRDPLAVYLRVVPSHGLRTHLQLRELVDDLQRELDTTTAVLSEVYALPELAPLRLSRQRVRSNLDERGLHDQLPYVPRRATLHSADDLFRLVISDLYGSKPVVAGRELLQNAVDAVRERRRWEERGARTIPDDAFHALSQDIVVELDDNDGCQVFRVRDRGIGMTPSTVIDQLLVAGASWGSRSEDEDVDADSAIRWMKAGRFGIGLFASFLLGDRVRVRTRHVEQDRGVCFVARLDGDVIELTWEDDAPFGTEIEIPCSDRVLDFLDGPAVSQSVQLRQGSFLSRVDAFYGLKDPRVEYRYSPSAGAALQYVGDGDIPIPQQVLPDRWRSVSTLGYDGVLWKVPRSSPDPVQYSQPFPSRRPSVAHNGIFIRDPTESVGAHAALYDWKSPEAQALLHRPDVAVFDSRHRLGVSLTRYRLVEPNLPFERDLLESIGADLVAFGLTAGAVKHPLGLGAGLVPVCSRDAWLPLHPELLHLLPQPDLYVLWRADEHGDAQGRSFVDGAFDGSDWRCAPHRAVLRVGSTNALARKQDYAPEWQIGLNNLESAVRSAASLLGRSAVASVLLRPGDASLTDGYSGWRKLVNRDGRRTYVSTDRAEFKAIDQLLTAAESLAAYEPDRGAAITVFRRMKPDDDGRPGPLTSSWVRMIGGQLERDADARQQRALAIAAEHRDMRPLLAMWQHLRSGSV
jgi:molecular chaperone HtpG